MPDSFFRWLLVDTPIEVRVLFFIVLVIAVSAFISVVTLAVMAARARRARKRDHPAGFVTESDFLWVFMVPARNEEVTIADSVGRLLKTQATNRVILAINDGSDDRTAEVLESLVTDDLHVLTRTAPNARTGKAAAINNAYSFVQTVVLKQERYRRFSPDHVIVGIVDADGRLAVDAPEKVAWHFADETVGGVQVLVRIYNRRGFLTWAQDVEFSAFGHVFQAARSAWGTANMGGNGQFNRLSALADIVEGEGPWRDRLTEDQDLGVRLMQAGWRGAQENGAWINQQGLNNLRRLVRQRTRWAQGAWQTLPLLPGTGRVEGTLPARIDVIYYLLTPILQLATGLALIATIILSFAHDIPLLPATVLGLLLFLTIGFGPGIIVLLSRGNGIKQFGYALLVILPYTFYSWLVFPALIRSLFRHVLRREGWAKTAREPLRAETDVDD